jgi:hypothetical protein
MPSSLKNNYTQVRLDAPLATAVREYARRNSTSLSEFLRTAVAEKLERGGAFAARQAPVSRSRKAAPAINQSSNTRPFPQ